MNLRLQYKKQVRPKNKHSFLETVNCIVCLKPAITWSGNVVMNKNNKTVIAGWCDKHKDDIECYDFAGRGGCFGGYLKEYGFRNAQM